MRSDIKSGAFCSPGRGFWCRKQKKPKKNEKIRRCAAMTRCFASDTPPSRYSRRHAVEVKVSVCAPFGVRIRFCQVLSTFRVSEERRQEGQQADQREQQKHTKKKMRESMVESVDSFYSEIHAVCAYIPCSMVVCWCNNVVNNIHQHTQQQQQLQLHMGKLGPGRSYPDPHGM